MFFTYRDGRRDRVRRRQRDVLRHVQHRGVQHRGVQHRGGLKRFFFHKLKKSFSKQNIFKSTLKIFIFYV